MTTQVIKATRATIILGDIKLDVFQMPDGTYRYGYEFLASLIERDKSILSDKKSPFHLLKLLNSNKTVPEHSWKVKVDSISQAYQYNTLSEQDLIECLDTIDDLGFKKAKAIMKACTLEALERRADAAFDVIRTEEERNRRHIIRVDGIVSRHFWTDVIDQYLRTHEVSDNYKCFIYINVSDAVNKAILGTTAKKYREMNDIPEDASLRDYLNTDQLKQIDTIEKASGMRVLKNDLCPKQALKDVIGLIC